MDMKLKIEKSNYKIRTKIIYDILVKKHNIKDQCSFTTFRNWNANKSMISDLRSDFIEDKVSKINEEDILNYFRIK